MKVGWLADEGNADGTLGGAELTQAEFRAAAPNHVEVVDMPPGGVKPGMDAYVIHNDVSYSFADHCEIDGPAFKYWHDVGPHVRSDVWEWLHAPRHICCSPLQREYMNLDAEIIPPAIDLESFRKAAGNAQERAGAVAVGPWMNPAKAPEAAAEWAAGNGGITFLGGGPYAPAGSRPVAYEDLPVILAGFKTFVHLPREIEPFGRSTVEAWAAGCEIVVNNLVGARHWILNDPGALHAAADSFWELVLN